MLDFIPWMDEVHIVEMGRLILDGGGSDTILQSAGGAPFLPLYYLGPCLQEVLFRAFGPVGPRLSPLLGLLATALCFRAWLKGTRAPDAPSAGRTPLASLFWFLSVLTLPLLVQSARQVRVDTWVFAMSFSILALLAPNAANRSRRRLVAAGALTAVSPFIWPTAVVLFPLYVAHGFPLSGDRRLLARRLLVYILATAVTGLLVLTPAIPQIVTLFGSIGTYFSSTGGASVSLAGVLTAFAKETLRAPFLMGLAALGFGLWARRRKFALLLAFSASLGACVITHCHTFRLIYLTPFFLLMAVDAADWLHARRPALAAAALGLTAAYGIATGPVAYALVPGERLPQGLEQRLAAAVGSGPKAVFTPDYSTYYLGRRLGWRQLAYGNAGTYADREASARLLSRADAVVMAEADRYAAVEETHTLYGLLRDRALDAARRERDSASKSPLARIGSVFATPWRPEIQVGEPFREVFSDSGISVHARR